MCCENFWKRLVTFCLTFWLGVFASYFFVSKELLPENKRTATLIPEQKNCVFADENLKYQTLPLEELPSVIPNPSIITPKKEEPKIKIPKNKKQDEPDIQKIQKDNSKPKPQLYIPSKDLAEYQILLHKEKCYESNGRK